MTKQHLWEGIRELYTQGYIPQKGGRKTRYSEIACRREDGKPRSPWIPLLIACGLGPEEREVQDIGLLSGIPGT